MRGPFGRALNQECLYRLPILQRRTNQRLAQVKPLTSSHWSKKVTQSWTSLLREVTSKIHLLEVIWAKIAKCRWTCNWVPSLVPLNYPNPVTPFKTVMWVVWGPFSAEWIIMWAQTMLCKDLDQKKVKTRRIRRERISCNSKRLSIQLARSRVTQAAPPLQLWCLAVEVAFSIRIIR